MRRTVLTLALLASVTVAAKAATAVVPSPQAAVARSQWWRELRASAKTGDQALDFPSPPRAVLMQRLYRAQQRYGFRIVSVKMLHPLQRAPVIVIRSDDKRAIARSTPAIVESFDPHHPTPRNPSGYAYEGYFFVAQDTHGVPYLATFNHWRVPHVGGGEWAADESLYPFPHG
jgi:hypothetical protein